MRKSMHESDPRNYIKLDLTNVQKCKCEMLNETGHP